MSISHIQQFDPMMITNKDKSPIQPSNNILTQTHALSTSEYNIEDHTIQRKKLLDINSKSTKNEDYIWEKYEIKRISKEIFAGRWKRVALQFPDEMLDDAWVVVSSLETALRQLEGTCKATKMINDQNSERDSFATSATTELTPRIPIINSQMDELMEKPNKEIYEPVSTHHSVKSVNSYLSTKAMSNSLAITNKFQNLTVSSAKSEDEEFKSVSNITAVQKPVEKFSNETVTIVTQPTFGDIKDTWLEKDACKLPSSCSVQPSSKSCNEGEKIKFYILADTSYGSCCVDEVSAQHVEAHVIVHFGRSCLSPTLRLPVIYVFTAPPLDLDAVIKSFEEIFDKNNPKVILMADIMFHGRVKLIQRKLEECGYKNVIAPEIIHDPSSRIPNHSIYPNIDIGEYSIFHISDPSPALLLTLNSRVRAMYIFPTCSNPSSSRAIRATSTSLFRRRYAILNSLNTCSIFGILINTLSVAHHLQALEKIRELINIAGKKYYTFVVGKVNAAKMANFSEIGGWVVIGCWESSLLECKDFYRPIITPWELEWVLSSEKVRIWNGEWRGDFFGVGERIQKGKEDESDVLNIFGDNREKASLNEGQFVSDTSVSEDTESESEPPEFDLRTGRYVSHSRPMQIVSSSKARPSFSNFEKSMASNTVIKRAKDYLATVGGEISPGAEYLRSQRTWTGLGCDFKENAPEKLEIDMGSMGIAREYVFEKEKS